MDKGEGAAGRKARIAQPTSLFGETRLDRVLGWGGVAFYVIAPILIGLVVLREFRPPSAHVEIAWGSAIHSVTIDTRRAGHGGTPQPGLILCDRERKLVISRITPAMAQAAAQCSGPSIVFSQGGFFRNARLRA